MNLSLAKKIKGQDALRDAIKQCTKLAAQHHPDRNPNNKAAAKRFVDLMTVRDSLKKRLPHACAVCGEPIGRTATHCRMHYRRKQIPNNTNPAPVVRKGNGNARIHLGAKGGPLAVDGFYLPTVQKVFKKWQPKLGAEKAESCFQVVASGTLRLPHKIDLGYLPASQWQCALELATALAGVIADKAKPEAWLLTHGWLLESRDQYGFRSWKDFASGIADNYGAPKFLVNSILKTAKRLQIITSNEAAADHRGYRNRKQSVVTK